VKALLHTRLINLRIGNYEFNPGIFATLITLALLYIMVLMAQWQSGKAEYKDKLHERIVARKDLPPVSLDELPESVDERLFMPVQLSGQFHTEHYILHDNRVVAGQVGYEVYAALRLPNGKSILINRGFVPQGRTRQQLPQINTPAETVQLAGLLDKPPSKTVVLAQNVNQTGRWPMVLQYVDLEEVKGFLGYSLFDMILWLDPKDPNSFAGSQPALNLDGAKNSGYAFQWYAMSAALTGIYFFVNIKKKPIP
jgi:surfeit locus 1 family protein